MILQLFRQLRGERVWDSLWRRQIIESVALKRFWKEVNAGHLAIINVLLEVQSLLYHLRMNV